jgi:hypothetical protein
MGLMVRGILLEVMECGPIRSMQVDACLWFTDSGALPSLMPDRVA